MNKNVSHGLAVLVGAAICYAVCFAQGVKETAYLNGQLSVVKELSVLDLQKSGLVSKEKQK
jgi:hypothetical protein